MASMNNLHRLCALLLVLLRFATASANTMVTGSVFCDQCRDGKRSLFDYPLSGARVAVSCGGAGGYREVTTNLFGGYVVRFEGSPDLSHCYARVVSGPPRCDAAAGPVQGFTLLFRVFGMAMYTVNPLLSQPARNGNFCSRSSPPAPPYVKPPSAPAGHRRPKPTPPPMLPVLPPSPPLYRPPVTVPRLPPLYHAPPLPFIEASACSYDKWMMPEYKCYWRVVSPDTKVALAFGPVAAGRYGMDMTLWDGLEGRGDLYRTLLREATTALLNSYNSINFPLPTITVINQMNLALVGSSNDALMTAVRFRRANSGVSGGDNISCRFSPCS